MQCTKYHEGAREQYDVHCLRPEAQVLGQRPWFSFRSAHIDSRPWKLGGFLFSFQVVTVVHKFSAAKQRHIFLAQLILLACLHRPKKLRAVYANNGRSGPEREATAGHSFSNSSSTARDYSAQSGLQTLKTLSSPGQHRMIEYLAFPAIC